MIGKTGEIITRMARRGAAVSMLVVLASCGGGQTERRPSARAEAFFKRAEAAEVARKAAIAGKPQPSDAGAQFPFQLDEAAKEAPFLIEAMWQDQFFTYIRTNTQKRIGCFTGLLLTPIAVTRTEDANLRFVMTPVRGDGELRIDGARVAWRYIRTEAAP